MTVLLKDAIKPNLVQTLEGQPASCTAGRSRTSPTATTRSSPTASALKLGDYVVTESGFGSDMGMEKFIDIVCRVGGLAPSAVVLVATVRALKHHGGDCRTAALRRRSSAARRTSRRHIGIVTEFGLDAGRRGQPRPGRHRRGGRAGHAALALEAGAFGAAESTTASRTGGEGAVELAEAVVDAARAAERRSSSSTRTTSRSPTRSRRSRSASTAPTASTSLPAAEGDDRALHGAGPRHAADLHGEDAPLALARPDAARTRPTGFTRPGPRRARLHGRRLARAALRRHADRCPGFGATPAAFNVDIDENGRTVGLF